MLAPANTSGLVRDAHALRLAPMKLKDHSFQGALRYYSRKGNGTKVHTFFVLKSSVCTETFRLLLVVIQNTEYLGVYSIVPPDFKSLKSEFSMCHRATAFLYFSSVRRSLAAKTTTVKALRSARPKEHSPRRFVVSDFKTTLNFILSRIFHDLIACFTSAGSKSSDKSLAVDIGPSMKPATMNDWCTGAASFV